MMIKTITLQDADARALEDAVAAAKRNIPGVDELSDDVIASVLFGVAIRRWRVVE